MRMVALTRLSPDMKLGKSVFAADGRVLLRKGVVLTNAYISRLEKLGFTYVYIDDPATADIEDVDTIPPEVRQEVVGRIKSVFDKMTDEASVQAMVKSGNIGREFVAIFRTLFANLQQSNSMIVNLSAIYSSDAHTYTHCMNVGVTTTILALASGYDAATTEQLGLGAMLHDIGKIEISPAIINKPGKLTDSERKEMSMHCKRGYDILRKQPDMSPVSAYCALSHHEWYDGSGYPEGLKGEQIHEFARLLAVPDVYDALTSNRSYRKAWFPGDALEFLYAQSYTQFDPKFVKTFVQHVNIYPVGLPVRLSNGTTGVVCRPGGNNLQRPVIRILEEHSEPVTPYELDLSKHLNITIVRCDVLNESEQTAG